MIKISYIKFNYQPLHRLTIFVYLLRPVKFFKALIFIVTITVPADRNNRLTSLLKRKGKCDSCFRLSHGFFETKSSHRYSCFVGINRYLITEPGFSLSRSSEREAPFLHSVRHVNMWPRCRGPCGDLFIRLSWFFVVSAPLSVWNLNFNFLYP